MSFWNENIGSSGFDFFRELRTLKKARKAKKAQSRDLNWDRYIVAKSANTGACIHCPTCGTLFVKKMIYNAFCKIECGQLFNARNKDHFHSREKGNHAYALLKMTKEQILMHIESVKALPILSPFNCVFCGRPSVKRSAIQCFCAGANSKCKERFRQRNRERNKKSIVAS